MLHLRLATSAILLTVVSGLLYLDHRYPSGAIFLLPLLLFFSVGTAIDVTRLFKAAGYEISILASRLGVAIVVLFACLPLFWPIFGTPYPPDCAIGRLGWIAIGVLAAIGTAVGKEMLYYDKNTTGAALRIQSAAFIVLYISVPMSFLVAIRGLGSANWGLAAVISLIAATKSADAGAYFSGRALGKHKLIPRLSPGKTIEGAIGGIIASIAVSYAMFHWLIPAMTGSATNSPWWGPIIFGFVCSIGGMFGDLAESLMKRDTGAKDSGNLLPGLGGVWDVTDSLIATAMPGFLCFVGGAAGTIG